MRDSDREDTKMSNSTQRFYDLADYDPTPRGAMGKAELEWWHEDEMVPAWVREKVDAKIKAYVDDDIGFQPKGQCRVYAASVFNDRVFARLTESGFATGCRFMITQFSYGLYPVAAGEKWTLVLALMEDLKGVSCCYQIQLPIVQSLPQKRPDTTVTRTFLDGSKVVTRGPVKASPTPWRSRPNPNMLGETIISDANDQHVATVSDWNNAGGFPNAELILAAVNDGNEEAERLARMLRAVLDAAESKRGELFVETLIDHAEGADGIARLEIAEWWKRYRLVAEVARNEGADE